MSFFLSLTPSSISTGGVSSGHSAYFFLIIFFILIIFSIIYTFLLLNRRSVIREFCVTCIILAGYSFLGSFPFLLLCVNCSIFFMFISWQCFSFFCTLSKLISFNLDSILSTVKTGFSIKYDEKKVCSIFCVGSIFLSFSFISFWTYVRS